MLSILLTGENQGHIIAVITAVIIIAVILLSIKVIFAKKNKAKYFVKESLLTPTEIKYYDIIRSIIGNNFLLLPQINLASVIDKKGGSNFRSELFRNVDFGIFDYDFHPIALIEINDNSHFRKDRIERDEKVLDICKRAKIPLVTFWVKDGINYNQMAKQLYVAINGKRK
ncbi:MAG: DUF2726 domain-containing protein [Clostridia bacterium]|nr:DUF2726 domain-containing protein [Clostridia bacterium]